MLVGAASIWGYRSQKAMEQEIAWRGFEARRQAQDASALLYRNFLADNNLSYRAVARTTALVGSAPVTVRAEVTRAPHQLLVHFLDGPANGVESGYSDRCFWRQAKAAPLVPYSQTSEDATATSARRLMLLMKNYSVQSAGWQTIAGRQAEVVELRPWHLAEGAKGPARRLYIDAQTGLTLGIDSFNYELRPVMSTQYQQVELSRKPLSREFESPKFVQAAAQTLAWKGEEMGRDEAEFKSVAAKAGLQPPRPSYLPEGFELEGYAVQRCLRSGGKTLAALSRYTDGVNTLTVFATRGTEANYGDGKSCPLGSATLISKRDGAGQLVALGDLPPETLRQVLDSAHFLDQKAVRQN